jgi:hypothetical protein
MEANKIIIKLKKRYKGFLPRNQDELLFMVDSFENMSPTVPSDQNLELPLPLHRHTHFPILY